MKIKSSNDRFIPIRDENYNDLSRHLLTTPSSKYEPYSKILFHTLFNAEENPRILNFWEPKKLTPILSSTIQGPKRQFPSCTSILDAPHLMNDFYFHPLSSDKESTMFVILYNAIYSQDLLTKQFKRLTIQEEEDAFPQSLDCLPKNNILSYSNNKQQVVQYYTDEDKHARRVTFPNKINVIRHHEADLFAGLFDGKILHYDLRAKADLKALNDSSTQKVCNIAFHKNLMAAGFNDNVVKIWDIRKTEKTIANFDQFTAAVRALSWHPSGTLFAGGGTDDKTIKILDVNSTKVLSHIDTQAQVTNLLMNQQGDELISCHGHGVKGNCSRLWKMTKDTLTFQSSSQTQNARTLFATLAENESTLITGVEDLGNTGTISIWQNIFPPPPIEKETEPFEFEIR